ncbi:MAG: D-serine ammonia-lyase, partial [Pyramidobacter sp.]|nr:D-serine ammonia-lyase [Pyramidobacter sp.]
MMNEETMQRVKSIPALADAAALRETLWINSQKCPFDQAEKSITAEQIEDARSRLERFAPLIAQIFPETRGAGGIIESELLETPNMKRRLNEQWNAGISGRLFLKKDSHLPIAGSIKARGGIYEVLKHAETLAIEAGLISTSDDYSVMAQPFFRDFFSQYKIQVGSTGNLGLSIGIMSAQLGFKVIVHMSSDARQWKKDLLRSKGAVVVEYDGDYGAAVKQGRAESDADPSSYFVDDENSVNLFLGYAV